MERLSASPLWPTITSEKGRTFGKTYGIKRGAIGNTLGTYWELEMNMLRTKGK